LIAGIDWRDTITNGDMFGVKNIIKATWGWMAYGYTLSHEAYKRSRGIGWGLITVGLVTILPLIFEVSPYYFAHLHHALMQFVITIS